MKGQYRFAAGVVALAVTLSTACFAQATEERTALFRDTLEIGAQIDAMDEKCRQLNGKDTSMSRPVVEQVLEGYALEEPTDQQVTALEEAARSAFDEKMRALNAQPELTCEASDFLWEKHALTKSLSAHLKKIIKARKAETKPEAL